MLDVNRLRVLVEVADRGSFSAAAEALFLTQPAVSRQVAALERQAGARLVERRARGVRLTQAGELAVGHGRAILARLAAADAQIEALTALEGGRLRLGAFASANTWLVPEAIAAFKRLHPRVELSLLGTGSGESLAAVRAGELDLALVTGWDVGGQEDAEGLDLLPLLDDRLLVALWKGHRHADRKRLLLRDLAGETWIEGAHPDCLGPLGEFSRAAGFEPRVGFQCDDWNGKQGLVASGAGVVLFPGIALPTARDDIVLRAFAPALPARKIYAAVTANGYRAPGVTPMIELLRETASAIG